MTKYSHEDKLIDKYKLEVKKLNSKSAKYLKFIGYNALFSIVGFILFFLNIETIRSYRDSQYFIVFVIFSMIIVSGPLFANAFLAYSRKKIDAEVIEYINKMRELNSEINLITNDQTSLNIIQDKEHKKIEEKKHFDNLNVKEKLLKIKNAFESGLLSKEEYENKRKKILDEEV